MFGLGVRIGVGVEIGGWGLGGKVGACVGVGLLHAVL